jgi:hypothetical protein
MASFQPGTSINVNSKTITHIDLTQSPSPPPVRRADSATTQARFAPDFSIERRPSSTHTPVSPPRLNRSSTSITASFPKRPSIESPRPSPTVVIKGEQKVTQVTVSVDNAHSMAKLSSVPASNSASRQVTPEVEQDVDTSMQQPEPTSPKYQTPRKPEWDVATVAKKLTQFRQDIKDGHSRMATYVIESTKPTERRVLNGNDLFAGITTRPVPAKKGETMRIRHKVCNSKPSTQKH